MKLEFFQVTQRICYLAGIGSLGFGCFGPYTDLAFFIDSWMVNEVVPGGILRARGREFVSPKSDTFEKK